MKASLQLNLSQQLTLTPQLQQAIRLLQLSTLDLNQEIQQILESNPMLEILDDNHDITVQKKSDVQKEAQVTTDSNFDDNYAYQTVKKRSSEDINFENFHSSKLTLHDHLLWQLDLSPMSETDMAIAIAIIDAVNDDGFLTQTSEELLHSIQRNEPNIELDEVEAVRHRIMRFDPIGVASHNLKESLLIQLDELPSDTPHLKKAKIVIDQDLELLGLHNYRQIIKNQQITEGELRYIVELIQSLNPRPGGLIESTNTEYVIPDVIVTKEKNTWRVRLNGDSIPKLSINGQYASLIQRANNSSDNTFLKNNLQEARWFLKSLQSRQDTLLKVATCIVEHQKDFLENGDESMKPLILNDVAKRLDMHESTISRVTTQKFIHTPRGVYELKYFFSSHVSTQTGGECSSTAIRAVIKKLIASENPQKPLSDNKITQILKDQGINVARRTIAKYREAMHIPPSNERKSLAR